jgi:hypothetical protein
MLARLVILTARYNGISPAPRDATERSTQVIRD